MTAAMTLTEFLLARIAEDEAEAHKWLKRQVRWPSRKILADCKAKRAIVESAAAWARGAGYQPAKDAMEVTLRRLGTVYAAHPDYRDEWKP